MAPFQSPAKRYRVGAPTQDFGGNAMLSEFKAFIAKGNVLDLAVAVIIGAAFATITKSLTDDIIMPIVGMVFGGLDFASYFTVLGDTPEGFAGDPSSYADLKAAGVPVLGWGQFITVVINFLILAFVIFLLVRSANKLMNKGQQAAGPSEVELLAEIRDELRKR
jgi:large conductance mechanosensitive channel